MTQPFTFVSADLRTLYKISCVPINLKMKACILYVIILHISTTVFCQTDFRKGYIITNAGDTISGLVDFRESPRVFKSCDFKKSDTQEPTRYEAGQIQAYGFVNDKHFESKQMPGNNTTLAKVFLEVIVKGRIVLYRFENSYWVQKESDVLYELKDESEEVVIDGKRLLKNKNEFLGILNMLMFDCSEIRLRIEKIHLDERDLTELIERYNACGNSSSITFKSSKPWIKYGVALNAGVNISKIQFEADQYQHKHLTGSFERVTSPILGLSFDIFSPRLSERFSFHGELLYTRSEYDGFNTMTNYSTVRNFVSITLDQLKIPLGFRYTLPEKSFTPYFNIGVSITTHVNSNSDWRQEVEVFDVVTTYQNGEALKMKGTQIGFWGGIGLIKPINKNLKPFVEVRYEYSDGVVPYKDDIWNGLSSDIKNFQFMVGVRFK